MQLELLPRLYGLDIETDTSVDGLDPSRSRVVAVAVSSCEGETVFEGGEATLLRALDHWLRRARPGILTTWNGAGFDLPFLADRARACGVRLGLELDLVPAPAVAPRHPPLPGHAGRYRARWHRHLHLDACDLYRALLAGEERSFSLKPLARELGFEPVEVDAARIHELAAEELRRYVASDAALARQLAERRWLDAAAFVDALDLGRRAVPPPVP